MAEDKTKGNPHAYFWTMYDIKGRIKRAYCFLKSFFWATKAFILRRDGAMLFIFLYYILKTFSPRRFDRYTMLRCLCLQINDKLKILWLSTFIDKLNLSIWQLSTNIEYYRLIDYVFDRHVTSCFSPQSRNTTCRVIFRNGWRLFCFPNFI